MGDMSALGVTESFQVKRQVLLSASEAAEMILRVDNIIKAAPRSVERHAPPATPIGRKWELTTLACCLCAGREFRTTILVRGRPPSLFIC